MPILSKSARESYCWEVANMTDEELAAEMIGVGAVISDSDDSFLVAGIPLSTKIRAQEKMWIMIRFLKGGKYDSVNNVCTNKAIGT